MRIIAWKAVEADPFRIVHDISAHAESHSYEVCGPKAYRGQVDLVTWGSSTFFPAGKLADEVKRYSTPGIPRSDILRTIPFSPILSA